MVENRVIFVCTRRSHAFWYRWCRVRIYKRDTLLLMTMRQRPYSLTTLLSPMQTTYLEIYLPIFLFLCVFRLMDLAWGCLPTALGFSRAASCSKLCSAAILVLFCFNETMPLVTNHKGPTALKRLSLQQCQAILGMQSMLAIFLGYRIKPVLWWLVRLRANSQWGWWYWWLRDFSVIHCQKPDCTWQHLVVYNISIIVNLMNLLEILISFLQSLSSS